MKRALASLLLLAAPALAGCAGDPALAASLANAARPSRLPRVVACWEKEFTDAPVQSGYLATVDFVIAGAIGVAYASSQLFGVSLALGAEATFVGRALDSDRAGLTEVLRAAAAYPAAIAPAAVRSPAVIAPASPSAPRAAITEISRSCSIHASRIACVVPMADQAG